MREKLIKVKNQMVYLFLLAACGLIPVGASTEIIFADDGSGNFNNFIQFLAGWLIKIGAVVAMIGGIQIAIGFKQDDPDAKVRGVMTLAAGFMVVGIGNAPSIFGIA